MDPQPYNVSIPDGGLFRAVGSAGGLYRVVNGKLLYLDPASLLQNATSYGNYGDQQTAANKVLQSQYGINYNSLPQVNLGDLQSAGIISADANGHLSMQGTPNDFVGQNNATLSQRTLNTQAATAYQPGSPQYDQSLAATPSRSLSYSPASSTVTINPPDVNLTPGQTGPQVSQLQQWLVSQGYLTPQQVATGPGIYGPQTTAALAQWQHDHGVQAGSNFGYFGPLTRAAISSQGTTSNNPSGGIQNSNQNLGTPSNGNIGGNLGQPTGNSDFDSLLKVATDLLTKLQSEGKTINPNIQITDEQLARFAQEASTQLHPYYASQLNAATDSYLKGLGYDTANLLANEQQAQNRYTQDLRSLGETSADQGFAQSGIRQRQEQQLAQNTQYSLDASRRAFDQNAYNTATQFARTYGGSGLSAIQTPTISGSPRVLPGQADFQYGTGSPLYNLSSGVYSGLIGSEQNAEKSATDTLASKLGSNYTQGLSNNQTRQLTF